MRKKLMTAAMTGLLSASVAMTALAVPGSPEADADVDGSHGGVSNYENGTDVYAGVILDDPDAKIKVEVPTLFAFVVNGTVGEDSNAISVKNGSLLLPNVMVEVDENDGSGTDNHSYSIQTVAENKLYFDNFSTIADEENEGARTGLGVNIKGSITNQGEDADRNYWTHVENKPGTGEEDFKNYRLSVNGTAFSQVEGDEFVMADAIELAAPDLGRAGNAEDGYTYSNLDEETNFAEYGEKTYVNFGVEVGGQRDDYKQVEESAKVGTIVWTVSAEIDNDGDTQTAPDNDYQQKVDRAEEDGQ